MKAHTVSISRMTVYSLIEGASLPTLAAMLREKRTAEGRAISTLEAAKLVFPLFKDKKLNSRWGFIELYFDRENERD